MLKISKLILPCILQTTFDQGIYGEYDTQGC
jgi:hypothetical protein